MSQTSKDSQGRLEEVLFHWMPRLQAVGLAFDDVRRVIAKTGSWDRWCKTWSEEGERHFKEGQKAERYGRKITAGECYTRAALYYHFGQFMFFDDLAQKEAASRRKVEIYAKAAPLLAPPAEPVVIPYRDQMIHGYLREATREEKRPVVLIVPGSDSTKEEEGALESAFLKRGLSTLTIDGPGQGEGRSYGPLNADWGPVMRAVAQMLDARGRLQDGIGVFGMAYGGHLVLQGAPEVPEIRGVVCLNGFYDLGDFWDDLPPVYRANMRFALGGETPEGTAAAARCFSLKDVAPPACPVLVIHGGKDRIFPPAEAFRIGEMAPERIEVLVYPEGNHVCNNFAYRYRALSVDWLADQLF